MSAVLDEILAGRPAGLSLDEFEAAVDELETAQRHRDEKLEVAREALKFALDRPRWFKQLWQKAVRVPPSDLNRLRDELETAFQGAVEFIDRIAKVMPAAATLAGAPLPGSDTLSDARAELTEFGEMIFSRWASQEELGQLMLDTIELPDWFLRGPNPPGVGIPQHWIDATDDDPFAPLPEAQ